LNLILSPYLFPKIVKIWPKNGLSFFCLKTLNNGDAQDINYPFIIIIIAP